MNFTIGGDRNRLSQTELILALLSIAILLAIKFYHQWRSEIRMDYNTVGLAINYIQFGAVHRGLLGSIIYLSHVKLSYAPSILLAMSTAALIILSFFMLSRTNVRVAEYLPFVIVLAALLLYWSTDLGRPDIVVAVILVMDALALVDGRILLASSFLAIGVLIHEVAVIYGLPLLAAILIYSDRYKQFSLKSLATSAVILSIGAIIYVAIGILPHSSNRVVVTTITSENPLLSLDSDPASLAFYAGLGGVRTIRATLCTMTGAHRLIQPFIALAMIVLTVVALSQAHRIKWILPIMASMPSILFLWMSAIDTSRWTALGVLNVWIVCAVRNWEPVEPDRRWAWARVICAGAIVPALYPNVVRIPWYIVYASPLIESAIEKAIDYPAYKTMDECDPTWRSVLSQG
jgi:hypothetical protein